MSSRQVKTVSQKLNITSPTVLSKAEELVQMIDVKVGSQALNALCLTGTCPVVMCLELAASASRKPFNKEEAIRLSGVNKKIYTNGLKTLESMLNLHSDVSIKDLAIQFGCTAATELAIKTLKSYEEEQRTNSCSDIDFTATMFQAAALCAACRKLKLKIDWTKLRDVCSIKKSTYDKLVGDMELHVIKHQEKQTIGRQRKTKTFLDEVEKHMNEEASMGQEKGDNETEKVIDDYEVWKKKILANAAKARENSA